VIPEPLPVPSRYKYTKNMNNVNIPNFLEIAEGLKRDVRLFAKVYCLQWFDDSFQNQGFTDTNFEAWEPRKSPDRSPGRAVLIDTSFLRKSLISEEHENSMEFGSHVPYAGLHNNGERMRVVQYVRAHHRTKDGKRYQVKPHSRKLDIKFPQRKFIGESKLMMDGLDNWFLNEVEKRFKQ
jgi:phage gpG-like protein